jgi:hypothetical protein
MEKKTKKRGRLSINERFGKVLCCSAITKEYTGGEEELLSSRVFCFQDFAKILVQRELQLSIDCSWYRGKGCGEKMR